MSSNVSNSQNVSRNAKSGVVNNFEIRELMRYKAELEELKTKEVAYKETIEKLKQRRRTLKNRKYATE